MQIKCYSLILLLIFFISCKLSFEKAEFSPQVFEKIFLHQEPYFSISIPEDWDFIDSKDDIDVKLKFTSQDKKINGYLKEYKFQTDLFTLDIVVNDYFSKKPKTDFKKYYKGEIKNISYYLLEGIFRDIYPIASIIFVKNNYLYEITLIKIVDQNELDDNIISKYRQELSSISFNIFYQMRFSQGEYPRLRKRYGIIIPCLKDWDFGLSTSKGEITSIGYKDKLILISLKILKEKTENFNELENELKKFKLDFIREMKAKKYKVIEQKNKIFNVQCDLIIVSNILVESRNRDQENTFGVVKKYYFIKNNILFELLIIYSMEDINQNILKEIDMILKKIKFER